MYVCTLNLNIVIVRAKNFCCKETNTVYSEIMFLELVIQHAVRMRHIFLWGQSGSAEFLIIMS
jgi:hypothetical protein